MANPVTPPRVQPVVRVAPGAPARPVKAPTTTTFTAARILFAPEPVIATAVTVETVAANVRVMR
ncbi:MAG: hypothetical protein NTX49_07830 [Chlamydiae bacterium]|nr:hypothetical protein [Chlamydiota bacterium]